MSNSNRRKKAPTAPTVEAYEAERKSTRKNVMTNDSTAVSNVIPFDFRGHSVRAVTIEGEPWFVAVDVCKILGQSNTTKALYSLDDDERSNFKLGRQGRVNVINESGLYTLTLRCDDAIKKGSTAHAFRRWVASEVLPSIRKNGIYTDSSNKMATLMDELIGMTETNALKGLARHKVAILPASSQRSAAARIYSAVHTRFNVPRLELIPASQFEAACNFVAAYAIEGEYLPHEKKSDRLSIHFPVEELARRRPGMLTAKAGEHTWLDLTLEDLRRIPGEGTPCEEVLWELERNGYEVEGALCELKTYRAKLREFQSWVSGMNVLFTEPKRYAVKLEDAA